MDGGIRGPMNRSRIRLAVKYGPTQQKHMTDYSVNISSGGVFIATDKVLPENTPLFVEYQLPGSAKPIICKAKVAWVNDPEQLKSARLPPGMGLQFFSLSRENLEELRKFLNSGVSAVATNQEYGEVDSA